MYRLPKICCRVDTLLILWFSYLDKFKRSFIQTISRLYLYTHSIKYQVAYRRLMVVKSIIIFIFILSLGHKFQIFSWDWHLKKSFQNAAVRLTIICILMLYCECQSNQVTKVTTLSVVWRNKYIDNTASN